MLDHTVSITNSQEVSCEGIFASLIELLKKELVVYSELKTAIIEEKRVLKRPKLDELNHVNAVKENIILKARMLEEARANILKKIARTLDLNADNTKLSGLAEYAGPEQKKEIEAIREKLKLISGEINLLNETNKKLLDTSLVCVKSSLEFISSIMSQGSVYMGTGKIKTVQNNGRLLHTEG